MLDCGGEHQNRRVGREGGPMFLRGLSLENSKHRSGCAACAAECTACRCGPAHAGATGCRHGTAYASEAHATAGTGHARTGYACEPGRPADGSTTEFGEMARWLV